nr:hypothetical protein [Kutzneria buriramensis]WKX13900.1 hypothetical protein Q4V64_42800 [Kutzneria buriramensis]
MPTWAMVKPTKTPMANSGTRVFVLPPEKTSSPAITPSTPPRATSARWARLTRGTRNDGTALARASTPVSALHPEAKAFSSSAPTVVALSARTETCPDAA